MSNAATQSTVTVSGPYAPGAVDEQAFARFVAKTEAGYRRVTAKHNARGRGCYLGWTEAEIVEAARFYCGSYRHHFRALVAIDPTTRKPLAVIA